MKKAIFLIPVLLISLLPTAYAHPFLLESDPPAATTVSSVDRVIIHFSEAVDVDFSVIKILDGNGDQVDNKDTSYFERETSLVVTTTPLEDGVYTVTTKVLSKIDGHLVDYALIFGVGDVKLDTSILEKQESSETVFVPESLSRFPGLVGQTVVLGSIISTILIWGALQKKKILESNIPQLRLKFENRFSILIAIGLALVFGSNLAMLSIQAWRLDAGAFEVIQTTFGMTWSFRMGITVVLLAAWFILEKIKTNSPKKYFPLLGLSLVLIGTTTMMGHGAASEQFLAMILDYIHNLLSAIWIGGVIFFGFVLLPSFKILSEPSMEKITLASIPKFSTMIVLSLGILLITGPILLWFLESNVNSLANSSYGFLIFAKIVVGGIMIAFGGFNQLKIFKNGEKDLQKGKITVFKKINTTLKIESALGIVLLLFVAFLTNSGLPAGEIQITEVHAQDQEFSLLEFTENAKFEIKINPFSSGKNLMSISLSDLDNDKIYDLKDIKVKLSNPTKNIAPIEIPMRELNSDSASHLFEGEVTFGFSGTWNIEIELQRLENINENLEIVVFVKPHPESLRTQMTEIEFPEEATPLFPLYDGKGNLWVSDPLKPRVWKYDIDNEQFKKYEFEGITSITLEMDNDGKIWFTDIPKSNIGRLDPETETIQIFELPSLEPLDQNPIAIALLTDKDNNIWVSITNKNTILKFDQETEKFTEYILPSKDSGPFALELGPENNVWYSGTISGKIGMINTKTGQIQEYVPEEPLQGPEYLKFDNNNNLWIAEHTGSSISKFNLILEDFEQIPVPDKESLPFGMIFDKYENLWFAQHIIDKIALYDPINEEFIEIEIPSTGSFTQFTTIDDEGNIWFVEQQTNKLGKVEITEVPNLSLDSDRNKDNPIEIKYAHIIGPVFTIGIVISSLFFVKSVQDKRRLDKKIP